MNSSESLINLLDQLQSLFASMRASAVSQSWAEVLEHQQQANHLASLIQTQNWSHIAGANRQHVSDVIKRILVDQEKIKCEIADWKSDVAPLLASFDAHPIGK